MNEPQNRPQLRSALFVDFDNLFISLGGDGSKEAETFATKPQLWLRWLEKSIVNRSTDDEPAQARRLIVRRCYLNPQRFSRYRPYFIRTAFEVVDCPPLTALGKTSADILMVLDLLDALGHPTRFDEFIIFSGDADFTPVLLRLRAHDRQTVVLAAGPASAAYKAAADLLIDHSLFIEDALGLGDRTETGPTKVGPEAMEGSRDVLRAIADRLRQEVKLIGAVEASQLPTIYREFPAFTRGLNWLGFLTLRAMTDAVVTVSGDLCMTDEDPWRVTMHLQPVGDDAIRQQSAYESSAVAGSISKLVLSAVRPVSMATLAQRLVDEYGEGLRANDWQGAGSFSSFVERLQIPGIRVAKVMPGYVFDTARHSEDELGTAGVLSELPDLEPLAKRISAITDVPYLRPSDYAAIYSEIAKEVNENGYHLTQTSKAVRDRCNGKGLPVSRGHVSFILQGINFSGYRMNPGQEEAGSLAHAFANNVLNLCRRFQIEISADEEKAIREWVEGNHVQPDALGTQPLEASEQTGSPVDDRRPWA